jgi:hypothetical protein
MRLVFLLIASLIATAGCRAQPVDDVLRVAIKPALLPIVTERWAPALTKLTTEQVGSGSQLGAAFLREVRE